MASGERKKIHLDFGRMSSAAAQQMSSDTIGDIGPSRIDELVASIDVTDAQSIQNFGAGQVSKLDQAIADLEAMSAVMKQGNQLTREGMEELRKSQAELDKSIGAVQQSLRPSVFNRARATLKGLMA